MRCKGSKKMAQKHQNCASIFALLYSLTFKVLIVLERAPRTAPRKAVLDEQPVAQIALVDHVSLPAVAADVFPRRGRLYRGGAVGQLPDAGVIERVDVDSQSLGVLREFLGAGNGAVVEAAGVVGPHRAFVVGIIVVNQPHPLYRIFVFVQLLKDFLQVVGNHFITHNLADADVAQSVVVRQLQVAQLGAGNGAAILIRLALHTLEHGVAQRVDGERLAAHRQRGNPHHQTDDSLHTGCSYCFRWCKGTQKNEIAAVNKP